MCSKMYTSLANPRFPMVFDTNSGGATMRRYPRMRRAASFAIVRTSLTESRREGKM